LFRICSGFVQDLFRICSGVQLGLLGCQKLSRICSGANRNYSGIMKDTNNYLVESFRLLIVCAQVYGQDPARCLRQLLRICLARLCLLSKTILFTGGTRCGTCFVDRKSLGTVDTVPGSGPTTRSFTKHE
jgi:hypothetical protein